MVEVADPAPDFTLKDQNRQDVRLSTFRGVKSVLLVFYPFAFTRVCGGELAALRDELPRFQNDRVQLLTVSVDSVYAQRVWADRDGFAFPMLSDFWPHGAVARSYGVFDEAVGVALRGTFLIDPAGVVRWKTVLGIPTARDQERYVDAILSLTA